MQDPFDTLNATAPADFAEAKARRRRPAAPDERPPRKHQEPDWMIEDDPPAPATLGSLAPKEWEVPADPPSPAALRADDEAIFDAPPPVIVPEPAPPPPPSVLTSPQTPRGLLRGRVAAANQEYESTLIELDTPRRRRTEEPSGPPEELVAPRKSRRGWWIAAAFCILILVGSYVTFALQSAHPGQTTTSTSITTSQARTATTPPQTTPVPTQTTVPPTPSGGGFLGGGAPVTPAP